MKNQAPGPHWTAIPILGQNSQCTTPCLYVKALTSGLASHQGNLRNICGGCSGNTCANQLTNCSHTVPGNAAQVSQQDSCPHTLFQKQHPTSREAELHFYFVGLTLWHAQLTACGRCENSQDKAVKEDRGCLLGCLVLEPATTGRKLKPCQGHRVLSTQKPLLRTQATSGICHHSKQPSKWFQSESSIQLSPEKFCITDQMQAVPTHPVQRICKCSSNLSSNSPSHWPLLQLTLTPRGRKDFQWRRGDAGIKWKPCTKSGKDTNTEIHPQL